MICKSIIRALLPCVVACAALASATSNVEAGNPHRGQGTPLKAAGWRVTHPFGGNGIPVVRRLRCR